MRNKHIFCGRDKDAKTADNVKKFGFDKYKASDKERFMEKISRNLSITEDITCGASIFTAVGRRNITIENYKGILEYSDNRIVIQAKQNKIKIEGCRLKITYFYDCEMRISGIIDVISFEK